jgi:peptide chain release factor subunit 1
MIRENALKSLLEFTGDGAAVLTLYLTVDPAQRSKYQSRLRAKELLETDGARGVTQDVARIEEFLQHEFDWQAKGLVIFSCQPKKFWQVVRLPIPVVDAATVADKPYVRQLTEVIESQERIGVALVDRERARFFGVYLGAAEELGAKQRSMVKRHKQQGPSPKLQRAADESAHQNLKQAAKDAGELFTAFGATQIIVAGQEEQVATFRGYLPKAWQKRISGQVALGTEANASQVLSKVEELEQKVEAGRQDQLVDSLEEDARKEGSTGTLGLDDTLTALMEQKVMTLLIADGFTAKGYQCENCGYLAAAKIDPCPACGHKMYRVEHAVDLAIRKALENDARVESIRADEPAQRLKKMGGIGALLRF